MRVMQRYVLLGCVSLALIVGGARVVAQEATPGACPTTSPEQNEQLVRDLFAAMNSGDSAAYDALLADDFDSIHLANDTPGNADEIALLQEFQRDFQDLHYEITRTVASGDTVAVEGIITGKNVGPLENSGSTAASNVDVRVEFMSFFTTKCGLVVTESRIVNALGLFLQTGHVTPAELSDVDAIEGDKQSTGDDAAATPTA